MMGLATPTTPVFAHMNSDTLLQAAGLLAERLSAWKHAVSYLEEYMEAVEKIHKAQAKEYERALKVNTRCLASPTTLAPSGLHTL